PFPFVCFGVARWRRRHPVRWPRFTPGASLLMAPPSWPAPRPRPLQLIAPPSWRGAEAATPSAHCTAVLARRRGRDPFSSLYRRPGAAPRPRSLLLHPWPVRSASAAAFPLYRLGPGVSTRTFRTPSNPRRRGPDQGCAAGFVGANRRKTVPDQPCYLPLAAWFMYD